MEKLHILLIDDSQHIRDFVVEYVLAPQDYQIDIATDGQMGLNKALAQPPDLILMDYEMPRLTGLEVLQKLRGAGSQVPVILMTSHGSESLAVEVFRLGVQNYLSKPFLPNEMLSAIEDALTVVRLQRERDELLHRLSNTNQTLKTRINELNILYHVSKSITSLDNPKGVLERIADAVLFVSDSQICSLKLIDPETQQLGEQVRRTVGGDPIVGQTSQLDVPLMVGQQQVGLLTIQRGPDAEFSSHDQQFLRLLGDYAAITINNLQLMYQLERSKEREKQQIRGLFEKYVTPSVVEQLLVRPDLVKLGGNREKVAVLFADIRGFSRFSTRIPPEQLINLLNRYLQAAADAVLLYDGTLDKFMGDAVMAFFNAPLAQPDYPLRALQAAWHLRESVAKVHAQLPTSFHLHFGIGVGVGEAVVGNVGTPQLMNFTIIGDDVNKVKRLQENAKGGQILISKETVAMVGNQLESRSVGQMHLKGQKDAESVYELVALNGV